MNTLLLNCQSLSKAYGSHFLFEDISLGIFKGDRIGLIGPNGSGKSTFLKILAQLEKPDRGSVVFNRSLKVSYVPQESRFPDQSIEEVVLASLNDAHHLSFIEKQIQVATTLTKLGFSNPTMAATHLSGGWQKRLEIAIAIVNQPDVILLDEPTNHLDLEGILWLEKFLQQASFAYIVITHDRTFLENVTNRMIELNKRYPKGFFNVQGSYTAFLEKRTDFLEGQIQQEASLNSKVRREIEWLKQNPKARTTKSSARIQEAGRLIDDLKNIENRNKNVKQSLEFTASERQTRKLLVATNIAKTLGGKQLFSQLNLTLSPGTRLGIVGLNGSGKSTLLKILAGEMTADTGTLKYADQIQIVHFDQHRAVLPPHISLKEALASQGDTVNYRGRFIHINAWCKRFLFRPERLDLPFGQLSGGEKARVHIARLMLKPADILLLDEPTNDLDIPTLEVLEESLAEFPGALVLISHDRYMIDQLTNVIVGLGIDSEDRFFADYRQWEAFQAKQIGKTPDLSKKPIEKKETLRPTKMSYSEKREWEQMEDKIMQLEQEIQTLEKTVETAAPAQLQDICQTLDAKHQQLEQLFRRWAELEEKKS